jgi:hypothetical protein
MTHKIKVICMINYDNKKKRENESNVRLLIIFCMWRSQNHGESYAIQRDKEDE